MLTAAPSSGMLVPMLMTDTPGTLSPAARIRPRFRFLRWLTQFLPKREIRVDGKPYLERYYLAGPISPSTARLWPVDDQPRPRLAWLLHRTWYLHKFHAPDADRDLHDHPWDARGRILAGAYVEVFADPATGRRGARVRAEGDRTHVEPRKYHRITALRWMRRDDPPEVWTLLRCGPYVGGWGYLDRGEHVPYAEYHARPRQGIRARGRRA